MQIPVRIKYQSKSLLAEAHQLRSVWRHPKHFKMLNLAEVRKTSFSSAESSSAERSETF